MIREVGLTLDRNLKLGATLDQEREGTRTTV